MRRDEVNDILWDIIDNYYFTKTEKAIRELLDLTSHNTRQLMLGKIRRMRADKTKSEEYFRGFEDGALSIIEVIDNCFPEDEECE